MHLKDALWCCTPQEDKQQVHLRHCASMVADMVVCDSVTMSAWSFSDWQWCQQAMHHLFAGQQTDIAKLHIDLQTKQNQSWWLKLPMLPKSLTVGSMRVKRCTKTNQRFASVEKGSNTCLDVNNCAFLSCASITNCSNCYHKQPQPHRRMCKLMSETHLWITSRGRKESLSCNGNDVDNMLANSD